MADQKTFKIHVFVLVLHCTISSLCLFLIIRAFGNPTTKNLTIQEYARIGLFSSMWVLQSIMLFMFWRLTRTAFRRIKVKTQEINSF